MADEIARLQKLLTQLDEAEEAVGKRLYDASTWRAQCEEQRRRAEALEKRVQDAKQGADAAALRIREIRLAVGGSGDLLDDVCALKARCVEAESDAAARRLVEIREVVGGGGDLVEDVRALKTRCEGAERETRRLAPECAACPGRQAVDELTLKLAEARRAVTAFEDQRDHAIALERDVRGALATCQRDLDAARRQVYDEKGRADGWELRAVAAESALAERNRQLDQARDTARHADLNADGLRIERARPIKISEEAQALAREWEAAAKKQESEAASLRAQLARRNVVIDDVNKALGVAQWPDNLAAAVRAVREERDSLRAQVAPLLLAILGPDAAATPGNIETAISVVARMDKEIPSLRAQVESLRGGAEPGAREGLPMHASVASRYFGAHHHATTMEIIRDLATLPSPSSPKTGPREGIWKCRVCGAEITRTALNVAPPEWYWSDYNGRFMHRCNGGSGVGCSAERLGDAPEVTP